MYELDLWRQPETRELPAVAHKSGFCTERVACSVHGSVLVLLRGTALLALEQLLAVFIKFESGDLAVRWVNRNLSLLSINLFLHHFVNVDTPSAAVDRHHLAFTALGGATENLHAVTLAYWD